MNDSRKNLANEAAVTSEVERPLPSETPTLWGSDVAAEMIRRLDIPYVALNPGASFRGLHDSLVNRMSNAEPQMLLCLHEEHAVAIAHGWAKVTERPMGAIVHSNVGLMHASMALFNAWCDRSPVFVLGATGPVDAARRRPWIDWIHTARDQGALVRPFTKWDDQPSSADALVESMYRAYAMAAAAPCGPTYVCLDAGLQEQRLETMPEIGDARRYRTPPAPVPAPDAVAEAAALLAGAKRPLILAGRVSRSETAWRNRIALAEALGAKVLTDLKAPAAFPSTHPLHAAPAATFLHPHARETLREADVVLSLDWIDLGGTLNGAFDRQAPAAKIIQCSLDHYIHNGWSMDHQSLPPVDVALVGDPDICAGAIRAELDAKKPPVASAWPKTETKDFSTPQPEDGTITVPLLAGAVREALAGEETCLIRGPLSWSGHLWSIEHPLDYLGIDGGAGLGSGPGMAVGAALALRGSGRIPLSMFGDGDFMMGATAIWTAAHYRIPMIIIVCNNQSFFNDELHQERMARLRSRTIDNKWIGQRIADPDIDMAGVAKAQGAVGIGPVHDMAALAGALESGLAAYKADKVVVIDVRVMPGYDPELSKQMANIKPAA